MSSCLFDRKGEHDHSNAIDNKTNIIVEESWFIRLLKNTALIRSYNVFPLPVELPYYGVRASISNTDVVNNEEKDTTSYTVDQAGTLAPENITGTSVNLGDGTANGAVDIGFDISYYANTYLQLHIALNGFISFDNSGTTGSASWTPVSPTATLNNIIAFAWNDLSPNISGTIRYETIGSARNKKMIIDSVSVPMHNYALTDTAQVQLYEGSDDIEIHSLQIDNDLAIMGTGQTIDFYNVMRLIDDNNTLRTPESTDRIWLSVTRNDYELQITALV